MQSEDEGRAVPLAHLPPEEDEWARAMGNSSRSTLNRSSGGEMHRAEGCAARLGTATVKETFVDAGKYRGRDFRSGIKDFPRLSRDTCTQAGVGGGSKEISYTCLPWLGSRTCQRTRKRRRDSARTVSTNINRRTAEFAETANPNSVSADHPLCPVEFHCFYPSAQSGNEPLSREGVDAELLGENWVIIWEMEWRRRRWGGWCFFGDCTRIYWLGHGSGTVNSRCKITTLDGTESYNL